MTVRLRDQEATVTAAHSANRLGFSGTLWFRPDRTAPVTEAFAAHARETKWARRILAAGRGGGAAGFDGEMDDQPVREPARRLLRAGALATPTGTNAQPTPAEDGPR